jgi:hypothetical protein
MLLWNWKWKWLICNQQTQVAQLHKIVVFEEIEVQRRKVVLV